MSYTLSLTPSDVTVGERAQLVYRFETESPLPLQKTQDSAQSFFNPNFSSAAALMAMTAPVMPTTEVLTQRS